MQDLIEYNTQRPHINSICIIMEFGLLRSNVLFGASYRFHNNFLGAESEIC
jgi:hypothetical protein